MAKIISIGRSSDCNYRIPESERKVSSKHAVLTVYDDGRLLLRDIGSRNGTFVNGKRLSQEQVVTHNDSIVLGDYKINLADVLHKCKNQGMVSSSHSSPVAPSAPENAIKRMTIGKDVDNDIMVAFDVVSRHHAILYQLSSGDIVVVDQNSTNGTFVNGQRVARQTLQPGDKLSLAGRHQVDWERQFNGKPINPPAPTVKWGLVAAIALAVLTIGAATWLLLGRLGWSQQKIYDTYNSSVCLVWVQYGYEVSIPELEYSKVESITEITGTGFFVSNDGKLITNRHVARPWTTEQEEKIEELQDAYQSALYYQTGGLVVPKEYIRVEPKLLNMGIIPNGVALSKNTLITCTEYNCSDNDDKDVAVLQTSIRALPEKVNRIVDYTKADISEEALKQGTKLYTIGFPAGITLGVNDNQELQNQIQDGSVTQDRGTYAFGHNCASTHGASGSPIFNNRGRLVGVLNAGLDGTQGFNQGIKAKYAIELLNK